MDNVRRLLELSGQSGKLDFDESGYITFTPSDTEKKKIEAYLKSEIDQSIADHAPLFAEIAENQKTYKASKTRYVDGEEETLPVPLASIAADQIISWTYNTTLRPKPIASFDPYFGDTYQIAVPLEVEAALTDPLTGAPALDPMGQPITQRTIVPVPTDVDAEEATRYLEQGYEFKLRERLNFGELWQNIVTDVVIGGIAYVKVCADRSYKTILRPKVQGATIDFDDKDYAYVKSKEAVKWYCLPANSVLKPIDAEDLDSAAWVAEKCPISPEQFTARFENGEFPLLDKVDDSGLANSTSDVKDEFQKSAQKAQPTNPKQAVNMMEVQFRWPVKVKDENGVTIKNMEFVGEWHHDAGRICSIHQNPYDHQQRYIVPFWQIKDPHSFSGSCTVGRLKWHQRAITSAIQADYKNAYHANNFSYWYVEGSPAADYFEKHKAIRSGEAVPGKFGEEWGVTRVGEQHYSMLPLAQWTEGSASRVSNVSAYEQGDAVPGRTPAATVAQILQQGLQQPLMFLRTLNDSFVKLMRLRILTERQFQPLGETLPIRNQKTRAIIEIPFRYPVVDEDGIDPLDNIRISLTAADEALAKETELEQIAIRQQQWISHSNFVAQVAGPMVNLQATPAMVELFRKIIDGANEINKEMVGLSRGDEETFDLSTAVDALIKERELALMQQEQMGGMVANPNAQAGGAISGGSTGPGGGNGMAPPPPDPLSGGPPPTEGLPQNAGPIQ